MKIRGFTFSAIAAGVRYPDRLDIGLIHAEKPCVTAGVFTTSQVRAAPVLLTENRLQRRGEAQTVLLNSGCANACTGREGMAAAEKTGRLAARALGIDDRLVLVSSTGVIGEQLNVAAFEETITELVDGLAAERIDDVARAIMTTDTVPKTAARTVTIGGREISLVGVAKGSGMIMPDMATMLACVCTDAAIDFVPLQKALRRATARTFNRITVDGDTSTNDMVLVMAGGGSGGRVIDSIDSDEGQAFAAVLEDLLKELAIMIVRDGEGATKLITVCVEQAADESAAEQLARTVANSALVKTAFFGEDANWGRILAALGRAGVEFFPEDVSLFFNGVQVVSGGLGIPENEARAAEELKAEEITLTIRIGTGTAAAEVWTCDLSHEYVSINAEYRS